MYNFFLAKCIIFFLQNKKKVKTSSIRKRSVARTLQQIMGQIRRKQKEMGKRN